MTDILENLTQIKDRLHIACFSAGREPDSGEGFYLAMEYVPGRNLAAVLREHGRVEEQRAGGLCGQVLRSLAEAHEQGVVHRDVKPANIMVTGTRDGAFVKVLDLHRQAARRGRRGHHSGCHHRHAQLPGAGAGARRRRRRPRRPLLGRRAALRTLLGPVPVHRRQPDRDDAGSPVAAGAADPAGGAVGLRGAGGGDLPGAAQAAGGALADRRRDAVGAARCGGPAGARRPAAGAAAAG